MKTLIFLRHAKSDWSDSSLDDFDRTLNARGRRDAPFMANEFANLNIFPDKMYVSSAKRTRETASHFIELLKIQSQQIEYKNGIYTKGEKEIFELISCLKEEIKTAMFVGHNPDISRVVRYLTNNEVSYLVTCQIVVIKLENIQWIDIKKANGKVLQNLYPKMFFVDIDDD